jgi:hypothetical protein
MRGRAVTRTRTSACPVLLHPVMKTTTENGFAPADIQRMTRRRLDAEVELATKLGRRDGVLEALGAEIARRDARRSPQPEQAPPLSVDIDPALLEEPETFERVARMVAGLLDAPAAAPTPRQATSRKGRR